MSKLAKQSQVVAITQKRSAVEVALLCHKDGDAYWIRGYEVFDPEYTHSTSGGKQALKVKTKMSQLRQVPLMRRGQQGKPVFYDQNRVVEVLPDKHYFTFAEVFGTGGRTGGVIIDAAIDAEVDDLSLGLTTVDAETDEVEPVK